MNACQSAYDLEKQGDGRMMQNDLMDSNDFLYIVVKYILEHDHRTGCERSQKTSITASCAGSSLEFSPPFSFNIDMSTSDNLLLTSPIPMLVISISRPPGHVGRQCQKSL